MIFILIFTSPSTYMEFRALFYLPICSNFRDIEQDLKEHRHRKKSVIQMKNGAPVYDSEEGTDEEAVP